MVPVQAMHYLPFIPRLKRLYASMRFAPHMRCHREYRRSPGVMSHPSDGEAWKHFDNIYPDFASEPRNVRLGLCSDGFAPFSNIALLYSYWPVFLTSYNLPPEMCMTNPYIFLSCVIPGHQIWERVSQLPKVTEASPFRLLGYGVEHNWTKQRIFWELPYWKDNLLRHNLDVMHIEKNYFDNLFNTVMDVKGKTKDNPKARMDIKEYCRRKELWLQELQNGIIIKPKASFSFTLDEKREIIEWVKNLRMPEGYASNLGKQVYDEYSSVQHLQLVKEVALGLESQVLTMNKYCVNGFKFQTEEVSRNKKINNSGVYIQGDVDGTGQTIEYYGVIQEIIEVRYSGWPKKKIVLFRCEWFDPSHRGTKVDHQHNIIEVKHTKKYSSYDPFIIAQNAKQVYYAPYPLRRDKADWWVVIKSKHVGRIEIDNVLDVAYQNDVAIVQQQVDVELETTLQHPQHILEKVSDDEILNVEEEISENEENKSFDDEEWDDNENETTEEEEWENDGIETSEEE
ncbi:hypothetical protein MTR67_039776 [Solanum verrucosum]|uniref:DUF4216 domain-containing protein n=1 Tax=Solanum verrucosum TaxID=315347 RepID=A0AAF0UJ64_SOLVR|nr:hypothetical protein MTR67_039776 [Solanum verrucosum]